jgi:hypothetical protein
VSGRKPENIAKTRAGAWLCTSGSQQRITAAYRDREADQQFAEHP